MHQRLIGVEYVSEYKNGEGERNVTAKIFPLQKRSSFLLPFFEYNYEQPKLSMNKAVLGHRDILDI